MKKRILVGRKTEFGQSVEDANNKDNLPIFRVFVVNVEQNCFRKCS